MDHTTGHKQQISVEKEDSESTQMVPGNENNLPDRSSLQINTIMSFGARKKR